MNFEVPNNNSQEESILSEIPEWTKRIIRRSKELIQQKDNKELSEKAEKLLNNDEFISTIVPQEEWAEDLSSDKADTDEKATKLEEKLAQDLVLLIKNYKE